MNSLLGGGTKSGRIVSGGYRRVHQDGVMMLDRHYEMKDSTFKIEIMQNRVKRLLFEEERARKLESLAKNKADRMLEARDRHQKELF